MSSDRGFGLLNGGLSAGDRGVFFEVAGVEDGRLSGRWQRGADGGALQPFEGEGELLFLHLEAIAFTGAIGNELALGEAIALLDFQPTFRRLTVFS
ncbi:hypothetical protein [Sphaerothrix gracilis]|uniref:hypothetical protein n=1 Tax=Sphaerothrix gracilis TaxID=3151835 RepID=UPI0031FBE0A5